MDSIQTIFAPPSMSFCGNTKSNLICSVDKRPSRWKHLSNLNGEKQANFLACGFFMHAVLARNWMAERRNTTSPEAYFPHAVQSIAGKYGLGSLCYTEPIIRCGVQKSSTFDEVLFCLCMLLLLASLVCVGHFEETSVE